MTTDTQSRLAASLPSMLMTYLTGAGADTTPTKTETLVIDTPHAADQQSIALEPTTLSTPSNIRNRPSLLHTPQSHYSSRAPSPTKSFPSFMYGEAENMSHISGDLSREGSFMSTNGKSKRRSYKPKTSYTICQPPPKSSTRQKIHVRARPLLQLHKLAAPARPMPAFELLPSAIFSPSLSRAISKVLPSKHNLCPADMAIVRADKYHQHEESNLDEDESRDVLALICKGRKGDNLAPGSAKIFLDDNSEWEAYGLPNGGYEFVTTDIHGLSTTVRWVYKRPRAGRSQSAYEMDSPRDVPLRKFNFSTISPHSRRHPVIANLTNTTLDINDSYVIPPATSPALSSSANSSPQAPSAPGGETVDTSETLRTLVTATAVWVALREGWCPGYKNDDTITRSPSSKLNGSPLKAVPDLGDGKDGLRRSGSIARVLSTMKRRSTASAPGGDGSFDEPVMSRNSSLHSIKRRPRAESAATVIHRTTWPRPEMRGMRKYTAGSTTGGEMTEEEEGEDESEAEPETPPPKSAPIATSTPVETPVRARAATPVRPDTLPKQKRESSATDMTIEAAKMEASIRSPRKRDRFMRLILCGMA